MKLSDRTIPKPADAMMRLAIRWLPAENLRMSNHTNGRQLRVQPAKYGNHSGQAPQVCAWWAHLERHQQQMGGAEASARESANSQDQAVALHRLSATLNSLAILLDAKATRGRRTVVSRVVGHDETSPGRGSSRDRYNLTTCSRVAKKQVCDQTSFLFLSTRLPSWVRL